jgi:hypothetical protein
MYIYLIHSNWWRNFMVNSKLVVEKKRSAPRLEGKRKKEEEEADSDIVCTPVL